MHQQPVGPHPDWSCLLEYAPEVFGSLVPWLALNRGKLVVFTHPETDDGLADHRDHAHLDGRRPATRSDRSSSRPGRGGAFRLLWRAVPPSL